MPVRNGSASIERALDSLLSQTFSDFEVLVGDNFSTDDTFEIAMSYAAHDPRVRVFRQGPHSAATNFEMLFGKSSSDLFMWAAHDDRWAPTLLGDALDHLASGPAYVSFNWFVGDIEAMQGVTNSRHPLRFVSHHDANYRLLRSLSLHHHSFKCNLVYSVFRSDFLRQVMVNASIANDDHMASTIAWTGSGVTDDRALFFKEDRTAIRSGVASILRSTVHQVQSGSFPPTWPVIYDFKTWFGTVRRSANSYFPQVSNKLSGILDENSKRTDLWFTKRSFPDVREDLEDFLDGLIREQWRDRR